MFAKWIDADGRFAFSIQDNSGVEITDDEHAALQAGQSQGKIIGKSSAGYPELQDCPAPTTDETAFMVRAERDKLIADTDYLLMPDYPIDASKLAAMKVYRQALRDITTQTGFPQTI